jgi:hypothetical protein
MITAFAQGRICDVGDFFGGKSGTRPRPTDPAFEIADVTQLEIQEHQGFGMLVPVTVVQHVFEPLQSMHPFAGSPGILFVPTLATCGGLFACQE